MSVKTLEEVKGRCFIDDDGCWIWRGAASNSVPRVYAPDWTLRDGAMSTQCGRRAVWHITHPGSVIPPRVQIFGKCGKWQCLNPECAQAGPKKAQGAVIRREGWLKGKPQTRVAARKTGRARSVVTPEIIAEIQASPETGLQLAARLGISMQTVSKARRGQIVAFQPVGGFFGGLGAR